MSRAMDRAATDLVARLRLPVIAAGLTPGADPVARRLAWAACGTGIAVLHVLRAWLAGGGQ